MTQGRQSPLKRLYELEIGESIALRPDPECTLELLAKRLRQVCTRYLREGKAYRLAMHSDHVLATRVRVGSHRRNGEFLDMQTGELKFVASSLTWPERKSLLAKLDRMRGGYWQAEVHKDGIYVRRIVTDGERLTWWERGNREHRQLLDLCR